jgi:dolichol-phosphate mannosyltransferase
VSARSTTLVVIPTYDEAETIDTVLARVREDAPDVDILVVDDGSPDGTAAHVARHPDYLRRVHLLERDEKEGLGAAYRAGFAWAAGWDYERVVQMDADLSHPPERITALVEALDHADLAVGSRYVAGGGIRDWTWHRRLVSWAGNVYVRLVLGLGVHDATAGFKAFRMRTLELIDVTSTRSNGYCFQIENTWRAERLGLRVVEVPITFTDRTEGESKMSGAIVVEAVLRVLGWRWDELVPRRGRPTSEGSGPRRGHATA